ncbi:flagellar protein FlaG [Clostridium fallax]|uniref:Flagellar protein FlaG n=1 Tax=Clostridium fallax TaxID=1533 RepID=A0A1M4ULY8_9CLOT|nr:flagellar protein FlaG [Clostridium fallax]SHE57675.1 flagellar protein FlaG [Clostridium fallax]SQB07635.1 flaG family protein [Clostridium fallax]
MSIMGINGQEFISVEPNLKNSSYHFPKENNEKEEFSKDQLEKALKKLNKFLEDDDVHAEYDFHEKFGDLMIKIVSDKTNEVLMEIPPKKILDVVSKLCELSGVVFDKRV